MDMKWFYRIKWHILMPILFLVIAISGECIFHYSNYFDSNISSNMVSGAYAMIGFAITALTFFISFAQNEEFKRFFERYHKKVYLSSIILSILFNFFVIVLGSFVVPTIILFILSMLGLIEILFTAKYTIQIVKYNK